MSKSVTVNFDDGTSHVYDNVPDDVTDDQVSARAAGEFSDKTISGIGGNTTPATDVTPAATPSMAEKAAAGLQTGFQVATQALPYVKDAAEIAALYQGGKAVNRYLEAKNAAQAVTQAPIGGTTMAKPTGAPAVKIPINQPATSPILGANGQPMTRPMPAAPATPPAPTVGGPAAAEGSNFIERITRQFAPVAERVAPVLKSVANSPIINNPVTRFAASAPVMGAQLALTPSSTGPAVPSRGPARGTEINPATGRPWTAQELQRYHAQY